MKYKIVGGVLIFLAAIESLIQAGLLRAAFKLRGLYANLDVQLPLISRLYPFLSLAIIGSMLYAIYIGYKLLRVKGEDKKLLKLGMILLVAALTMLFVLTGFAFLSIVNPIYSLTDAF